jgi:hypothetical protein
MVKKILLVLGLCWAVTGLGHAAERKIPIPRLKPVATPPAVVVEPPVVASRGWSKAAIVAARLECRQRLKGVVLDFEFMPPFGQEGGCGAASALMVRSIAGVTIMPPAELTCDMAEALYAWVSTSVQPAAQLNLKKKLIVINNASAYACRRRNNSATGKISEHAKANAFDIATLGFSDGSETSIKGDWSGLKQLIGASSQGAFLRRIRRDACIRFTTVLGPGSDRYHGDHFHVDVARRRNGYRICS